MEHNNVSIELRYDADFKQSVVEKSRPDPLTGMKVKVGDTYVFGDENHVNSDYMSTNLTVQLEAVEKILTDERTSIEFANGPMWLVFEPHDAETVKITGCSTFEGIRDPERRTEIDASAVLSKTVWISELIRTAEEFHEKVVELDPDLEDDEILQGLRTAITDASERLEAFEAEST